MLHPAERVCCEVTRCRSLTAARADDHFEPLQAIRGRDPTKTAGYVAPCAGGLFKDCKSSTAARSLDCSDVDLYHLHHRIERALGDSGIGIGDRFRQGDRRNLPGQSPFVLAPAAYTFLAAVADDCVPVTIRFGLVNGCDLKRKRFVVLDLGTGCPSR